MLATAHEGWTNFPTWCVNLWLSNDEPAYRLWSRMATIELEQPTGHKHKMARIADALRDEITEAAPRVLGPSLYGDLLTWALGQVEWREIAKCLIEEATEQKGAGNQG